MPAAVDHVLEEEALLGEELGAACGDARGGLGRWRCGGVHGVRGVPVVVARGELLFFAICSTAPADVTLAREYKLLKVLLDG